MTMDKAAEARRAAVLASKERQADEARIRAQREADQQSKVRLQDQYKLQWATMGFQMVHHGVMTSGEGFAREGSEYVIEPRPNVRQIDNSVTYEIRGSGSPKAEATVTFQMDDGGWVRADTSARGCEPLPDPVLVHDITVAWATSAADVVMIAVLAGQRMRIAD
jgi:hypothetical protein